MIRLTIVKPDRQTITIDHSNPAELTVGRSSNCNICLDFDSQASRQHAKLFINPPEISVKDLHSTNGIVVNGVKYFAKEGVDPQPIALFDGDRLIVGQTKIKIGVSGAVSRAKRPSSRRVLTTHRKGEANPSTSRSTRQLARFPAAMPTPTVSASRVGTEPVSSHETVTDFHAVFPVISGWDLLRFVGVGVTGNVYMGEEASSGKTAAVKAMGVGEPFSRTALEALRRDADDARNAAHAHIARYAGMGEIGEGKGAYLAYEYVHGEALPAFQEGHERGRIPPRLAVVLMTQLTEAVCFLHRRDIVHMDLKPSSVIVQRKDNGRVRAMLTDHGYFSFLDLSGIYPRGMPSERLEKLGFVAPEMINPDMDPAPSADVFSLASIFYWMLTGKAPYRFAPGRDNLKVVHDGWMLPVDEAMPEIPGSLSVVIERGLSVDPDMRYGDACHLLEALESI